LMLLDFRQLGADACALDLFSSANLIVSLAVCMKKGLVKQRYAIEPSLYRLGLTQNHILIDSFLKRSLVGESCNRTADAQLRSCEEPKRGQ
jgi:hypothetical protein